jgi:hypothetical protein
MALVRQEINGTEFVGWQRPVFTGKDEHAPRNSLGRPHQAPIEIKPVPPNRLNRSTYKPGQIVIWQQRRTSGVYSQLAITLGNCYQKKRSGNLYHCELLLADGSAPKEVLISRLAPHSDLTVPEVKLLLSAARKQKRSDIVKILIQQQKEIQS